MDKNAPTKKIENWIDEGMEVWTQKTLCVASYHESYLYEGPYDFELDGFPVMYEPKHYTISYHDGLMPAFHTDTFYSLQDLANAMRDIAPLSSWCKQKLES